MTKLPTVFLERKGKLEKFHGSWYRGEHTNFLPRKQEIYVEDGIDEYILHGWMPPGPFIDKNTPIVAFGSCFASNISEYLGTRGYNVLGRNLDIHSHLIRFGEGMVNTFSIRQQIEWAVGGRQIPENMWFGPDKEIASVDSEVRVQTYDLIRSAKLFIITLGLSEIWYDKRTGDAFWRAIPKEFFDPDQHGFRVSTVQENVDNLHAIVEGLRKLIPDAAIILTLSPVPLVATFRPVSCLTANSVSKAILRVAVDELVRAHSDDKNLFYFPSYEIVKDAFIDPFLDDNRHPKPSVIARAMEAFERHFCRTSADR